MHPHPHHCRRRHPDDGCCPLVGAIPFYLAVTHNQEPGHVLLEEQRRRQCSPGGKKDSKVARLQGDYQWMPISCQRRWEAKVQH